MTDTLKRLLCTHCERPAITCLCSYVRPVDNTIPVIILQHPLETKQAKNTGKLLHLCLKNSQLIPGETFDETVLLNLCSPDIYDVLLYPETHEEKSLDISSPPAFDESQLQSPLRKPRLWVLDATWRKSRKMLYLNTFLQKMPRMALSDTPASIYKIRKAHSENQLSTLEATCYALQQLDNKQSAHQPVDYAPLLMAMQMFIDQQQTFIPTHPSMDLL